MNIHTRKTSGQDLDLSAVRARLDGRTGPAFWRSLEELADTEEFRQFLHREFPEQASELTDPASRRTFLRVMGASLALAGVGLGAPGCDSIRPPVEKILPYVKQPENIVPGKPLTYATAVTLGGHATGVLAETHTGRPTMLSGNPSHPDSLGAIDPRTQGALLDLYDPDRSQVILRRQGISTFDAFLLAAVNQLEAQRGRKGAGIRVLTETVTSPSLARQIQTLRKDFPAAKWHQYDPAGPHTARAGAVRAFGRDVTPRYQVDKADVILALDSDFLATGPGHLRLARQFATRRTPDSSRGMMMNRLYAVEPTVSVTGSNADHRLRLRSTEIAAFALTVARDLGVSGLPEPPEVKAILAASRWVQALAADLKAHKESSLVIAGDGQPAYVHALAHAMNQALGNVGKTVVYTEPVEAEPTDQIASIRELCRAMKAGEVELLLILGGNPVYNAPVDLGFAEGLSKVRLKAHLSPHQDETSALCDWHIPTAHELETWGDARASDGTVTIQQPLIAPLHGGRSALELLAALLQHPDRTGYEIVRATWSGRAPKGEPFDTFWQKALHEGVVPGTAARPVEVTVKADLGPAPTAPSDAAANAVEVVFRPDPNIWDGRFANNGWLQELPKPLTKLTWDNAALVSPATAQRLRLAISETAQE